MSSPTDIGPSQVIATADAHHQSIQDIGHQQTMLRDTAQALASTSTGSTMRKFEKDLGDWNKEVDDVRKVMSELADYMKDAARTTQLTDQPG